jgi:hypothetical protein
VLANALQTRHILYIRTNLHRRRHGAAREEAESCAIAKSVQEFGDAAQRDAHWQATRVAG